MKPSSTRNATARERTPCSRAAGATRRLFMQAVCGLVLVVRPARAQSEMVLHKEGTRLYHRASCPVVQDMKGVVAMTRAQASSRGYTAHPDCDPENPNAPAAKAPPPKPETVYLDGSKYYHRKTCAKIADPKSVKAVDLEVAAKSQWPCPTCRPPVRKKTTEPAVPGRIRR
jgi:hypothetical protein